MIRRLLMEHGIAGESLRGVTLCDAYQSVMMDSVDSPMRSAFIHREREKAATQELETGFEELIPKEVRTQWRTALHSS